MTKYKEYVQRMVEKNKELFDSFKLLHDKYALNEEIWQDEFNKEGEKILVIVRDWENKLCSQSEKSGYSKFTTNLSEKFRAEIKKSLPMIDHIGIKISKTPTPENSFNLKKINLQ